MAESFSKLRATSATFVKQAVEMPDKVLNATFITRHPPDVEHNAIVVGLCAIPHERQGQDALGWHIADFLAFKSLITPFIDPKSQVWLAQSDIIATVKQNPDGYAHGRVSDRRLVNRSARNLEATVSQDKTPIIVKPSPEILMAKFQSELVIRSREARKQGAPLVIFISGLTTLEQDIIFDTRYYTTKCTSEQIREYIDPDVRTIVVTPSLTSAGWQINPSFMHSPAEVRATAMDLMARQTGAVFASSILRDFLSWESLFIDRNAIDQVALKTEAYPGPAILNGEQKSARTAFEVKAHALLAARLAPQHTDHGFSFDTETDDWELVIGPRRGRSLDRFAEDWEKLDSAASTPIQADCLPFLGTAFGGNRESQVIHIKHLIEESSQSWTGYYKSGFGTAVRNELRAFLVKPRPSDFDCHAMFNVMEHRMSLMVLGDLLIGTLGLERIFDSRCRDWDEGRWGELASQSERYLTTQVFGNIHRHISSIQMPPGQSLNPQTRAHATVGRTSQYLAGALTLRYKQDCPSLDDALTRLINLIHAIQDSQIKILIQNPQLRALATAWLDSINIPVKAVFIDDQSHELPLTAVQCGPYDGIADCSGYKPRRTSEDLDLERYQGRMSVCQTRDESKSSGVVVKPASSDHNITRRSAIDGPSTSFELTADQLEDDAEYTTSKRPESKTDSISLTLPTHARSQRIAGGSSNTSKHQNPIVAQAITQPFMKSTAQQGPVAPVDSTDTGQGNKGSYSDAHIDVGRTSSHPLIPGESKVSTIQTGPIRDRCLLERSATIGPQDEDPEIPSPHQDHSVPRAVTTDVTTSRKIPPHLRILRADAVELARYR